MRVPDLKTEFLLQSTNTLVKVFKAPQLPNLMFPYPPYPYPPLPAPLFICVYLFEFRVAQAGLKPYYGSLSSLPLGTGITGMYHQR